MTKYVEKPLQVEAIQFYSKNKPCPDGVFEIVDEWMRMDMIRSSREDAVAYMYTKPQPYIQYLIDGDWIVTHDDHEYSISDSMFKKRFAPVE